MILLDSASTLQVVLTGAVATTEARLYAAFVDIAADGSTYAPGHSTGDTNGTTPVTWLASPVAGVRQVKYLSLFNSDTASVEVTVTAAGKIVLKKTIAVGERLEFVDGHGFTQDPVATAGGGSDTLDVSSPANVSGTVTLDFGGKSRYAGTITLGANVTTLAFANLPGAGKFAEYEFHIAQNGTGGYTFALPASHKALGGSDTAIASAAGSTTVLTGSTMDNGTTWRYAMQESA